MTKSWHGADFRISAPLWGESTGLLLISHRSAVDCPSERQSRHIPVPIIFNLDVNINCLKILEEFDYIDFDSCADGLPNEPFDACANFLKVNLLIVL